MKPPATRKAVASPEISQLARGEIPITPRAHDMMDVVHAVVQRVRPWAERHGTTVSVSGPDHVVGSWDPMRMEQVVDILLSNALRFGAGKPVRVVVRQAHEEVIVQIVDEGGLVLMEESKP